MRHMKIFAAAILGAAGGLATLPASAFETPREGKAEQYLGQLVKGPNYKIAPSVRSDGFMRIFIIESSYGRFQVNGVDLVRVFISELRAVDALEKMSQSEVFAQAFGKAATAPLRFGADLLTNPVDAVGRSLSGVANMVDRAGAGMANQRAARETPMGSLLGVDDARREIAIGLGVDPYSDFPPLSQKLQEIAGAAASGGIPVKVALAAIPGGVGLAISSASSIESVKDALRDKTSAQIIQDVRATLFQLGVPNETITRFVENRTYTPTDLLVMARALARLNAGNTEIFIAGAADANAREIAFFHRRRAELLASRSTDLGGVTSFVPVAGFALNQTRNGNVVAAFPFDEVAWTPVSARTFNAITPELRRGGGKPVLVIHGAVTRMAADELKKLGWQIVQLR